MLGMRRLAGLLGPTAAAFWLAAATPDPLWIGAERVLLRCHLERAGLPRGLDPAALEEGLCRGLRDAVARWLGNRLAVRVAEAGDAALVADGSVVLLLHARAVPASAIVPDAEGTLVALGLQTARGEAGGPPPSWFAAAPTAARLEEGAVPPSVLEGLAADLLGR